jgi:ankyrin repeat protein
MNVREETSESLISQHRKKLSPDIFTRPIVDLALRDEKVKSTRTNDPKLVSSLLLANNSIHHIEISSRPDIYSACRNGDVKTLKRFFSRTPYVLYKQDKDGKTPLIYASMEKRVNVVKWLLNNGVRSFINDVDMHGRTALHYAALVGCSDVISALRRHGAITDVRDLEGRTPLHLSTGNLDTKSLKLLLRNANENDINEYDSEGMVPLHWAVLHNRTHAVRLIVRHKDVDLRASDIEGKTPLHLVFTHTVDTSPYSPFSKKTKSCAEILLRADPGMINQQDLEQRTILHQSTGENNYPLVDLLTRTPGCNINAQDVMKRTPLHYAAVAGYTPILELLLSRNADDSVQDSIGASPLHYASSKNHAQCVTALLSRESESCYNPDNDGRFPLGNPRMLIPSVGVC